MQAAARATRLQWQPAVVETIEARTPSVKSFFLRPAVPFRHVAGQHVDIRLTAPDGYQAQRSYSIASAPESTRLELIIELLADGEVSPFFHETVATGDEIELRGPIGGHFMWSVDDGGPLLLLGGGSGVVPLLAMLRHRAARGSRVPAALVYSARSAADLIAANEVRALDARGDGFSFLPTLTREAATGLHRGRIDVALLRAALDRLPALPQTVFVCGANPFVETATGLLLALGLDAATIRTERYGG